MVVMVTCKNCGHEYKTRVLQTPDEETLRSETRENVIGLNGRCAIGVIMSYYGWDGKDWTGASSKLFAALFA
jgi:hypothetical protein